MLKKLIKYDLKWINKLMLVFFAVAAILSLFTRITGLNTSSFAANILHTIVLGFTLATYALCIFGCEMRIWVRFRNNTYKDESYLTHTLPVAESTMFNSKMISSIISIILCVVVVIICAAIGFLNKDTINYLKDMFNNKDTVFMIGSFLLTFILETTYIVNCGILGILLGHRSNNKRTLKSIVIGLVLYFIMQNIILGIIYLVGLMSNDIAVLFSNNLSDNIIVGMKKMVIIVNVLYLVIIAAMYFVGKKIYNKGVDVD